MKTILLSLSLMIVMVANGQTKKTVAKRPIYRDSIFYKTDMDTTYGTVIIYTDSKSIAEGEGMLIRHEQWEQHEEVPRRPMNRTPYLLHGRTDTVWILHGSAGWGKSIGQYYTCYIKTKDGWLYVKDKYKFKIY